MRRSLNIDHQTDDMKNSNIYCSGLRLADKYEIREIILASHNRLCSLDTIARSLIKKCVHSLLTFIQHLVNTSLFTGSFPDELNSA